MFLRATTMGQGCERANGQTTVSSGSRMCPSASPADLLMRLTGSPSRTPIQPVPETILERVIGLREMFPEPVQKALETTASYGSWAVKGGASFGGKSLWVLSTSLIVLFLPAVWEAEKDQVYQQQDDARRQQEQLVSPRHLSRPCGCVPRRLS